jgi:phage gp29-like protein
MSMIGGTGAELEREELLPQLRGGRWHRTIREMSEQDPTIAGILFAIEMTIRRAEWSIQPASDSPEDVEIAEFIEGAMFRDLRPEWENTLSEILSFLPYGWAVLEVVYKRRTGPTDDPRTSSHFTDGRIGWGSWSIRPQETLSEWVFDDGGELVAMKQIAPPKYVPVEIPIDKALLFRTSSRHGRPEGLSILRAAYQPWYYKKEIQKFEAIGVERDLAGVPVAWVSADYWSPNATPEQKSALLRMQKVVTNLRRNQQEGVVMPLAYDKQNNKLYDLQLLTSGGQRQIDTDKVIQRYDTRIAMSVLADFIMVGHEQTGTYSMAESKTDLFITALEAWLDSIAAVINEQAIHPLLRYNGITVEREPQLKPGKVQAEDLEKLGAYLKTLADAGVLEVTPELQRHVLEVAKLPTPQEDAEEETEDPQATPDDTPDDQVTEEAGTTAPGKEGA